MDVVEREALVMVLSVSLLLSWASCYAMTDNKDKALKAVGIREMQAIQCRERCGRGSVKSFELNNCECYSYK